MIRENPAFQWRTELGAFEASSMAGGALLAVRSLAPRRLLWDDFLSWFFRKQLFGRGGGRGRGRGIQQHCGERQGQARWY